MDLSSCGRGSQLPGVLVTRRWTSRLVAAVTHSLLPEEEGAARLPRRGSFLGPCDPPPPSFLGRVAACASGPKPRHPRKPPLWTEGAQRPHSYPDLESLPAGYPRLGEQMCWQSLLRR